MGELIDKGKQKIDDMENKAFELKGRVKQKAKDMKKDK